MKVHCPHPSPFQEGVSEPQKWIGKQTNAQCIRLQKLLCGLPLQSISALCITTSRIPEFRDPVGWEEFEVILLSRVRQLLASANHNRLTIALAPPKDFIYIVVVLSPRITETHWGATA